MCKSGHRPKHESLMFMFHAGREFKPGHVKSLQGRTPYGAESPSRLARPGQGSELQASDFHLPRAGPPPPTRPKVRQRVGNTCPTGANPLKRTELRTPPSNFQLAKPLGAVSKHENPKPACAVHASAIVSFPEAVFALLSLGHITGCDLVHIPSGWASVGLADRLFSDSCPFQGCFSQCRSMLNSTRHGCMAS